MIAAAARDAKARVEVDLTKALNSLAVAEEGRRRSEAEITRLGVEFARVEVERESLLLELEASKRDVSSLHAWASKDREDMGRITMGLWTLFLLMAMGVAHSRTTSVGIGQTSQMACLTSLTHFPQSSLTT